jgi:hypothetical protein
MHKTTLTLLVSGSFLALTLITNPADASPLNDAGFNPVIATPTTQIVSLNRAPAMFEITTQESDPIQEHLGCSCATCKASQSQI